MTATGMAAGKAMGECPDAVILTRPSGHNEALAERLADIGLPLVIRPALSIEPLTPESMTTVLAAMQPEDWVFFVSPRAVRMADRLRPLSEWRAEHLAAVGRATAAAIRAAGRVPALCPPIGEEESEGVLRMPAMQAVRGRRVWIVRGQGGRDLLRETLTERGAEVAVLEVYRRGCPEMDLPGIARQRRCPLWLLTSPQALRNIHAAAATADLLPWLLNSELIVINARGEALARELGFTGRVDQAGGPDDVAMATAVRRCLTAGSSTTLAP